MPSTKKPAHKMQGLTHGRRPRFERRPHAVAWKKHGYYDHARRAFGSSRI